MLTYNSQGELFIDRDGKLFKYILEFYRNGEISLPSSSSISQSTIFKELHYFNIPLSKCVISTDSWEYAYIISKFVICSVGRDETRTDFQVLVINNSSSEVKGKFSGHNTDRYLANNTELHSEVEDCML